MHHLEFVIYCMLMLRSFANSDRSILPPSMAGSDFTDSHSLLKSPRGIRKSMKGLAKLGNKMPKIRLPKKLKNVFQRQKDLPVENPLLDEDQLSLIKDYKSQNHWASNADDQYIDSDILPSQNDPDFLKKNSVPSRTIRTELSNYDTTVRKVNSAIGTHESMGKYSGGSKESKHLRSGNIEPISESESDGKWVTWEIGSDDDISLLSGQSIFENDNYHQKGQNAKLKSKKSMGNREIITISNAKSGRDRNSNNFFKYSRGRSSSQSFSTSASRSSAANMDDLEQIMDMSPESGPLADDSDNVKSKKKIKAKKELELYRLGLSLSQHGNQMANEVNDRKKNSKSSLSSHSSNSRRPAKKVERFSRGIHTLDEPSFITSSGLDSVDEGSLITFSGGSVLKDDDKKSSNTGSRDSVPHIPSRKNSVPLSFGDSINEAVKKNTKSDLNDWPLDEIKGSAGSPSYLTSNRNANAVNFPKSARPSHLENLNFGNPDRAPHAPYRKASTLEDSEMMNSAKQSYHASVAATAHSERINSDMPPHAPYRKASTVEDSDTQTNVLYHKKSSLEDSDYKDHGNMALNKGWSQFDDKLDESKDYISKFSTWPISNLFSSRQQSDIVSDEEWPFDEQLADMNLHKSPIIPQRKDPFGFEV